MLCLEKALVRLFFIFTSLFKYFFIFFYFFSLFLAKLFTYIFRSGDDEYDEILYEDEDEYEEEEEEEEEEVEECIYNNSQGLGGHLVANILNGGETLDFMPNKTDHPEQNIGHTCSDSYESMFEDPLEDFDIEEFQVQSSNSSCEFEHVHGNNIDMVKKETNPNESIEFTNGSMFNKSPLIIDMKKHTVEKSPLATNYAHNNRRENGELQQGPNFTMDEKFLDFAPPKSEAKKAPSLETQSEEMFGDTYTVGSTSKSSSEWRSSIRDSTTEDPSSSSSRRSCPKWESYTVYQKYDEEMMYLDRISTQKLHETDSLRSFRVEPRSISQRIIHTIAPNKNNRRSSEAVYQNTYHELEATYVAQICLAWEALNWNYTNFVRKKGINSRGKDHDHGCPAHIAQQFQQFQVLVQRYIENEPYERGRRPEIYARIRSVAHKLLQVPEYHDYEEEQKEKIEANSRISSESFLTILEEAMRTFMNFLMTDRGTHCQVLAAFFRGRRKGSILIDPLVFNELKKYCQKMKTKLKDLQHRRSCLKRKRLAKEEEIKVLMGLIDLKIVSRVMKMRHITQEQLQWCEDKMSKIKVLEGKLQRDSSPLFFPAH